MFQDSPDRNPQDDPLRTPKATPKSSAVRKSPLRQYLDKAKGGDTMDLSPSNKEVKLNFAATKDSEVQELREQLKELRDLMVWGRSLYC